MRVLRFLGAVFLVVLASSWVAHYALEFALATDPPAWDERPVHQDYI